MTIYSVYKTELTFEPYLQYILNDERRKGFTNFRAGAHSLNTVVGRLLKKFLGKTYNVAIWVIFFLDITICLPPYLVRV